jgi:trehalose synthase
VDADVWVVHDPQPLPLRSLVPLAGPALWRCHIDSSSPNGGVSDYLLPWVQGYERSVFSLPDYVLPGLPTARTSIAYPAIDPLTEKNRPLPLAEARGVLARLGLDPGRPLVTQVSRFDPWKNPWEVIDAYRIAKRELPDLQAALVGVFSAKDDPEGPKVHRAILRYAGRDPDIHLFTDPIQVAEREVNAFQTASTVILQRSTREGFGLTVTEAMWKGTPVIGTPVGGITVQITDGRNGFLTNTAEATAERIIRLVREPELAREIGLAARASVRADFLLPRLLRDDLALYAELTQAGAA